MAKKTQQKQIRWDLTNTLGAKTDEELIKELQEKVEQYTRHKEKLETYTAKNILTLIEEQQEISVLFSKIKTYYSLQLAENTQQKNILAKDTAFSQIARELSNKMIFFPVWFIHLKSKKANAFIQAPELAEYSYYLYTLYKDKPHTFTEKIERLLSLKSAVGRGSIYELYEIYTTDFEFDFQGEKVSREILMSYTSNKDPALREEAYNALYQVYEKNATILTEMYKYVVIGWGNDTVKIRNYKTPINARNKSNDISDEAVQALLSVIRKNVGMFKEYFKVKYEINKQQGAHYPFTRRHLYAPFALSIDKEYSYKQSKAIVLDTYKQFDKRFYKAAKEIFDAQHVHVFPQKNKRGGAFCYSSQVEDKPYIFLNHTNKINDVFTMMHEFGHGIHAMLARKQKELNYGWAIPIAETASIFAEQLLYERLLKETQNDDEKKVLLIKMLDGEYASIGRQAYFTIFEEYAHKAIEKGATQEELEKKWLELLQEQFGEMQVEDMFKYEYTYVPHLFATPFYCYGYAWGNLFVLSLYAMYEKEGNSFKDKFVNLLSSGNNKKPEDLMAEMGVNPRKEEFWQEGFDIIKKQVKRLKKLI